MFIKGRKVSERNRSVTLIVMFALNEHTFENIVDKILDQIF